MAAKQPEAGSFGSEPRELCPSLVTSDDLILKLGSMTADIINKDKVIAGLWANIDELLKSDAELQALRVENNSLKETVERVESEKVGLKEAEGKKRIDLKSKLHGEILQKAEEIQHLKKTLKSIEGEAIINQEELRRELMIAREALNKSKQVVRQKRVKKKVRPVNKASA